MKNVETALKYRQAGFSVIPMSPENKRPLIKWTEFQTRLPTDAEIKEWWQRYPTAMIGIVTGSLSGIVVVDCDSLPAIEKIQEYLPENYICPVAQTPRGGRHFYFQCPKDGDIQTVAGIFPSCDVRGQGGVIVCPPSVNSMGKAYAWLPGLELSRDALQEMPAQLSCALSSAHINKHTLEGGISNCARGGSSVTAVPSLFSEGRRDTDLFTLANSLVKSGMSEGDIFRHLEFTVRSWGEHDETWINAKIQSALKRQKERTKSLSEEIEAWISVTERDISVTDCDKETGNRDKA